MRRNQRIEIPEALTYVFILVGAIAVALILIFVVRVRGGLLGLVLGVIAVGLLVYWLREFSRTFRKEIGRKIVPVKKEWSYDILSGDESTTVIAEVPGSEDEVEVKLVENNLEVKGGQKFSKTIALPSDLEIVSWSYTNGILEVRLKKDKGKEKG